MTEEFVIGFTRQAIELTLSVALPMLGVGLAVGIVVSVIQAATQIQEMTLTFIPKVVSIFTVLILAFPWIMDKLNTFTINLFLNIPRVFFARGCRRWKSAFSGLPRFIRSSPGGAVFCAVNPHHDPVPDGLGDEQLHGEGKGEIARPFVEKQPYGFRTDSSAAYPGADYGQQNRHQENVAQDIDGDMRMKAVVPFGQLRGQPHAGLVGNEHQSHNAQPYKRQGLHNPLPYPQRKS